jgi:hypothetical protein
MYATRSGFMSISRTKKLNQQTDPWRKLYAEGTAYKNVMTELYHVTESHSAKNWKSYMLQCCQILHETLCKNVI